jgi:Fur family ferric uptake transcriptional regulator
MSTPVELVEDLLREAGLRVTRPRIAVLEFVRDHPHSSAELIAHELRDHILRVSTQAVYNVLSAGMEAGLVRRMEPSGSAALFEIDRGDGHHHLVCRWCGRVTNTFCAGGGRRALSPTDDFGYRVEQTEVVFWGVCPTCQSNPPPAEARHGSLRNHHSPAAE